MSKLSLRDLVSPVDEKRAYNKKLDHHIVYLQNVISHLERAKSLYGIGQPALATNAENKAKSVLSLLADQLEL